MEKIRHLETKFSIASYELIKACEPNELRFYLWLKLWAINKHSAWPSVTTITEDLGINRRTMFRTINSMKKKGRLIVKNTSGKNNTYDITWYDQCQNGTTTSDKSAPTLVTKQHLVTSDKSSTLTNRNIKRIESNDNLQAEPASISKVIEIFQPLNSRNIYGNKTQREATKRLLARLGEEKLLRIAKAVIAHQGARFCPVVTSPYELEQKMGKVAIYFKKESAPKKLIMGIA